MNETASFSYQILDIIQHSPQKKIRFARILLLLVFTLLAFQKLSTIIKTINQDWVYSKDMFVYYIVANALRNNENPYQTIDILADQFISPNNLEHVSFISPPPAILAIAWMSLLELRAAGYIWLVVQLICIAGISGISNYLYSKSLNWKFIFFFTMVLIGFPPFTEDLIYGNLSIVLFFLLMLTWVFIKNNQTILAGIFLGTAIAIKIYFWPFALFFLMKKNYKLFFSTGATIVLLNSLSAAFIGFDGVLNYYLKIPAQSGSSFLADSLSLWSIGWRLFLGLGIKTNSGIYAPPLIYNPELAQFVSYLIPILFLIVMMILLWHQNNLDISFAILACGCLLLSPIAWTYYFVLLLIPFIVIYTNLKKLFFPNRLTLTFALVIIFHYISFLKQIAIFLSGKPAMIDEMARLSFAASTVLLLPTISVLILIYILINISYKRENLSTH